MRPFIQCSTPSRLFVTHSSLCWVAGCSVTSAGATATAGNTALTALVLSGAPASDASDSSTCSSPPAVLNLLPHRQADRRQRRHSPCTPPGHLVFGRVRCATFCNKPFPLDRPSRLSSLLPVLLCTETSIGREGATALAGNTVLTQLALHSASASFFTAPHTVRLRFYSHAGSILQQKPPWTRMERQHWLQTPPSRGWTSAVSAGCVGMAKKARPSHHPGCERQTQRLGTQAPPQLQE